MASYQTRQRSMLLDYLRLHPDESFTAEELAEQLLLLHGPEAAPGKSTVYRLVSRLVEEEQVKRFEKSGSRKSYYQIIDCCGCEHLHLKCTGCGRLIHMEENSSHRLLKQILLSNHFAVDEHQTVLFGRCNHCRAH